MCCISKCAFFLVKRCVMEMGTPASLLLRPSPPQVLKTHSAPGIVLLAQFSLNCRQFLDHAPLSPCQASALSSQLAQLWPQDHFSKLLVP